MVEEHASPRRTGRTLSKIAMGAILLFVAYQGVRWGIRSYTDGIIEGVVGRDMPDFSLRDLEGRTVSKSGLLGKTVVLNFFRSRCSGCWSERDAIRALAEEVDPAQVAVVGVMMDAVQGYPAEVSAKTLAQFAYRHPVVMADQAFVDAFHGVGWSHITPITYVVDPKGQILASFRHPYPHADLRAMLP